MFSTNYEDAFTEETAAPIYTILTIGIKNTYFKS